MKTHQIGVNTVYEDDDLLHTVCNGETTLQMVQDYLKLAERILAEKGRVFLLSDASKTLAITSDARRYITEWSKTHQITAVANVVNSPVVRAMMNLVTAAMRMRGQPAPRTIFVSKLADAQAWIVEERKEYLRKHPDPTR
jgi:hypothetical protein